MDVRRGQGELPVHIDMTFPSIPCPGAPAAAAPGPLRPAPPPHRVAHSNPPPVLSLDSLDMAGAHEFGAPNAVKRSRVAASGKALGDYETPEGERELLELFGATAQMLLLSGLLQVGGQEAHDATQAMIKDREGCRLHGVLLVARVAGQMHVTVHAQSITAMRSLFPEVPHLNTSHSVRAFSFGPHHPGRVDPLSGAVRAEPAGGVGTFKARGWEGAAAERRRRFRVPRLTRCTPPPPGWCRQYFMKLVPTTYRSVGGWPLNTMQYRHARSQGGCPHSIASSIVCSFFLYFFVCTPFPPCSDAPSFPPCPPCPLPPSLTEYYTRSRSEAFTPAVSISYDFSPLAVESAPGGVARGGWPHLALRLCAVAGGVASLVGALDRWAHRVLVAPHRAAAARLDGLRG